LHPEGLPVEEKLDLVAMEAATYIVFTVLAG
jgi:hypothetical protein